MFRSLPVAILCLLITAGSARAENWPGWRGPRGDGSSVEENVPTKWNGTTGENVLWKVELPGWGHGSPIVWEDRIFTLACIEDTEERVLLSLDRKTGKVLWQEVVFKAPLEKRHKLNSFASSTPATDGDLIYVTFLEPDFGSTNKRTPGDIVVAAYDFSGKLKWRVKPGRFASVHGFCSSPVIYKDKVIVNGDHDGDSYIVGLDSQTGETSWQVKRAHKTRSYVTPLIREIDGRTQMVLSGSRHIASYDPSDGKMHWKIEGPTEQYVASLVYDGDLFFMTAGFPEHHVMGIRPDGKGDVTKSHVQWHSRESKCYVPSPAVLGKYLFIADDRGTATCYATDSGEVVWKDRLGNHFSASLITANELVYFTADNGITKVVRPGGELDVVEENELGEYCYASPIVSHSQIYLRGEKHLFCIGNTAATAAN